MTAYCVAVSWADDSDVQVIGPFDTYPEALTSIDRIAKESPDNPERSLRIEEMFTQEKWLKW